MSEQIKQCPFCPVPTVKMVFNPDGDDAFVEYSRCKTQGPSAKNEAEAIAKWNAAYNALEAKDAEIKQLRDGIAELSRDFLRETKRVAAAANALAAKDAEIERLTEACDDMQGDMLKAQSERDTYLNLLSATEKERDELQDERNVLQKELDRWRDMVIPLTAERDELKAEIEQLRKERHTMCIDYERVEQERDEAIEHREYWRKAHEYNFRYWQREYGELLKKFNTISAERDEARRVARHWYTRNEPPTSRVDATEESDT